MLTYPDIDPIAFSVGFISIRWYSLAYLFGILIAWWLVIRVEKWRGTEKVFSKKELDDYIFWLMLGIILGGRLGYCVFYNFSYYMQNPLQIFQLWTGGMSFHGAVIGIILATGWFSYKFKVSFFKITDYVVTFSPIGIFLGRISNFINGELYGRVSDVPWAMIFPGAGNLPRHPSQLYEAFFEGILIFIILAILFIYARFYRFEGRVSALFFILYGVFRFFIEYFREPDAHIGLLFNLISTGQLLCLLMIFSGIFVLFFRKFRKYIVLK